MNNEIVARMREEEADLSRKLAAVRQFLAAYGEAPSGEGEVNAAMRKPAMEKRAETQRGKISIDGYGAYGRGIVANAMMAMIVSPSPVKTRKIVEHLDAMGVDITGENKINAVGALLSRSSDIVSHGKSGWTLADEESARAIIQRYAHNENEAPNDMSSEPQKSAAEGASTPAVARIDP